MRSHPLQFPRIKALGNLVHRLIGVDLLGKCAHPPRGGISRAGAEIGEDEVSVPVVEDEVVEEDVRKEEVDVEDRTERLGGRAQEGRRGEEHPVRATGESERRAEQPGREGTGEKEGFLDKAMRKLEGR
jgi:hypothetical protein